MPAGRGIRAVAVCVVSSADRVFVVRNYDLVKGETYYRPLGGGIEFGEHSRDAVLREFREEIGAELENVRHLCALENIFALEGELAHEIVQVYEARFADESWYAAPPLPVRDSPEVALWKPLGAFVDGERLVPEGLLEMISDPTRTPPSRSRRRR